MLKTYLLAINFLLLIALGVYLIFHEREKRGYIITQEVFNGFTGKQDLETKLKVLKENHKTWTDSVVLILQKKSDQNLLNIYQENLAAFQLQEQELSQTYTADIWKQINHDLKEFGKENGYIFIFGASGDGSLMYADEAHNITGEVVAYINMRYKGPLNQ